ncbi:MAG TPA: hypothetical protein VID47_11615 [Actinomycetota bacterium]
MNAGGDPGQAVGTTALATWWVWIPLVVAVAAVVFVVVNRHRQRAHAARGWQSRAAELYSRGVALHDRLAPALAVRLTLSPEAIERLGDAEWMVGDVAEAVAGLEVGAPNEPARMATSDLATSLGSFREGIHMRVQMPDSADASRVLSSRLHDLEESLGRFRQVARSAR